MKKSKYSSSTFFENEVHLLWKLIYIKEDLRHHIFQRLIFFFLVLNKVFRVDANTFIFICLYLSALGLGGWALFIFLVRTISFCAYKTGTSSWKAMFVENFKYLGRGPLLATSPKYFLRLSLVWFDLTGTGKMTAFPRGHCKINVINWWDQKKIGWKKPSFCTAPLLRVNLGEAVLY